MEQWVKGDGEDEILITGFGGLTGAGPVFTDGDFLLEAGRRYILTLDTKRPGLPGPGSYESVGTGLGNFEVTDGVVHVLNNPLTRERPPAAVRRDAAGGLRGRAAGVLGGYAHAQRNAIAQRITVAPRIRSTWKRMPAAMAGSALGM